MKYKIEFTSSFKRDLQKVEKSRLKLIFSALENLSNFPHIQNLKKLKVYNNLYRVRVGSYRILFHNEVPSVLTVFAIKKRKDVYKNL